jgi:hypothetical protein
MTAVIHEMWEDKFKRWSAIITLFINLILLYFYLTIRWSYPDPMPQVEPRMEIIPVAQIDLNAGGNEGSDGGSPNETPYEKPISENPVPTPTTNSPQHVSTNQNSNVSVSSGNNNTPTVNQNALFTKPTGNGTGTGNGDGDGPGTGEGDGPGTGTTSGNGTGPGHGNYNLAGRSALEKPAPKNVTLKEGKIVINIWVDRNGKVVRTKVNLDLSTINDAKLASECEKAAMNTKWSENDDADEEQKGSITYNFKLN